MGDDKDVINIKDYKKQTSLKRKVGDIIYFGWPVQISRPPVIGIFAPLQ